jgi:mono/diheme cytochrome c family protein
MRAMRGSRVVLPAGLGALLAAACALYVVPRSDGPTLYKRASCADCHGAGGIGGPSGPPLDTSLSGRWTVDSLAEFLVDPEAVLEREPRLAELSRTYGNRMPSYRHLTRKERRTLARHLLEPVRTSSP